MKRRHPKSTLFPYTTLFRSVNDPPAVRSRRGRHLVTTATKVNIKPLEDRVVVQANEAETTTASGLVIPDTAKEKPQEGDRKSTRLNSSHANISYAVFCLKKT